jgi:hypothetical protein
MISEGFVTRRRKLVFFFVLAYGFGCSRLEKELAKRKRADGVFFLINVSVFCVCFPG